MKKVILLSFVLTFLLTVPSFSATVKEERKVEKHKEEKQSNKTKEGVNIDTLRFLNTVSDVLETNKTQSLYEFKKEMKRQVKDKEYLKSVNPFEKTSRAYKPYNSYFKKLLTSDLLLEEMYKIILNNNDKDADFEKLGASWGEELAGRGLKKLNEKDFEKFVAILNDLLNLMTIDDCAVVIFGVFDIKNLELLPTSKIKTYLTLTLKSMELELKGATYDKVLTDAEEAQAFDALFTKIGDVDSNYVGNIMNNITEASSVEACWATRAMINNMLELKGEDKELMLRSYRNVL